MDGPYRATKLWNEMLHTFRHGMPLRRHRRHMKVYEDSFTGVEAVSWLQIALKSNPNIESGITKGQVRQLLNKFMKASVFSPVCPTNSGAIAEFKENEVYIFTSEVNGFNLPLMCNMHVEAEKYEQSNRQVTNNGSSVMDNGVHSCRQTLCHLDSGIHRIPKNIFVNEDPHSKIQSQHENENMASVKKSILICDQTRIGKSYEPAVMRDLKAPVPLSEKICNGDVPRKGTSQVESIKYPDVKRYGASQNKSSEVNYQHEPSLYPSWHKNDYVEKHGHESGYKFPIENTSHLFACTLAQPCISDTLSTQYQERCDFLRSPLMTENHVCSLCREGLDIKVKNDECQPLSRPTGLFCTSCSMKKDQFVSYNSLHTCSNLLRESQGNYDFYKDCSEKRLSDSTQFIPSQIENFSTKRHVHFNNRMKERKYWERTDAARMPCDKGFTSNYYGREDEAWRKVFIWRLEQLFLGMEELMALLPLQLPIEWLFENGTNRFAVCHGKSGCNELGLQETIENFQDEFTDIKEPLITVTLYNIVTQSFLYIERLNCKNCQNDSCQKMPASQSVENLVLGMASPCPPKPERLHRVHSENNDQIINDNILKQTVLPPNLCFETAFTSDSPVTRIVPQRSVDTLHLSRRGPLSRSARSLKLNELNSPQDGQVSQCTKLKRNASISIVPPLCSSKPWWKTQSSQDVKMLPTNGNRNKSKEKSRAHRVRYPWRESKKKTEPDQLVYSSQHCRNKSGGYVNPALSQSLDDISSHELASQELDYSAALEMLQTLMQHTHVACAPPKDTSIQDSNCDLSSENESYYTASSTPDQQRHCDSFVNKEPVWDEWRQPALSLGISIFQLLLLLISPASRRLLHRLLRCLHRLPSAVGRGDAAQIMYSLTPNILSSQLEAEYDRSLSYRVVKFLVANFEDILDPPADIESQVLQYIKRPQQVTYCEQVSNKQFEQQRLTGSQLALSELLDQILSDNKMGDKEKRRKIKLFKESYPHIYKRRFPEPEHQSGHEKTRSLLQFPSLGKLKNLRI